MISQKTINDIKQAASNDIEYILEELGCEQISVGVMDVRAECPAHGGDNASAFSYLVDRDAWKCFTHNCHEEDCSIFGLVKKSLDVKEGEIYSFLDAIAWLAERLNISIEYGDHNPTQENVIINGLIRNHRLTIHREEPIKMEPITITLFKDQYEPSSYFCKRGLKQTTIEHFLITEKARPYGPMSNRVYAPIISESGDFILGVTGRTVLDECKICKCFHEGTICPIDVPTVKRIPKWRHYGFKSGSTLYNIHDASEHILRTKTAIITEGPKNVWYLYDSKIKNSTSIFGCNLTSSHVELLLKYNTVNLILGLDNDDSGREASVHIKKEYGHLFNISSLAKFLPEGGDIADLTKAEIREKILPFIKEVESIYV